MNLLVKYLPKISIVTPSYNQGQYIEETILSVINQNYPNLEYIIIDGGSTDNTVETIQKYEQYITYWVSEPDHGQSHAINKGLEQCTGDVFNWLNSDDYYEPEALFKVGEAFTNPNTYVLAGKERRVGERGEEVGVSGGTSIMASISETIGKCHIDQPSTFFRLSALEPLLPLDNSFHYLMDGEVWLRFLLYWGQNNIQKSDEILVNFRLHQSSKTVSFSQGFQIDKNTFENNLLQMFNIDNTIKNVLLSRKSRTFSKKLDVNQNIDTDIIISFFSARSIEQFYSVGKYKEARKCLQFIVDHYSKLYNANSYLRYYQKALTLPDSILFLIKKLRKVVRQELVPYFRA